MSQNNVYESFRSVLIMNLSSVLPADQLQKALDAVDITMSDFEVTRKKMELITASGVPEVVKMYIASKAVANLSYGTLKQYRYKLFDFFNAVRKSYADVTPNDIRMYLNRFKVERNAGDNYRNTIRVTLNGFFTWLVTNKHITHNPCDQVDPVKFEPKNLPPLSPLQLEQFRIGTVNIREKALVDFFFSTGLRVSECAAVKLSDIDWHDRRVHVTHGKGNKERIVFFDAESEVSLRMYLATRTDDVDALFVSTRKPYHAIQSHALENIIKKISERTGIYNTPHKLRRSFATHCIRSGTPLPIIQKLMGHSNPETTLIYAKLVEDDLRREYQRVYA